MRPFAASSLDAEAVLAGHPSVRRARVDDLPRITEIYNQAVPERTATADTQQRSVAERRVWFDRYRWDEGCPLVVWEEDGEVLAFAGAAPFRPGKQGYDGCNEVSLYCCQSARGRGIGRRLGAGLVEACRALNNRVLMALVFADNSRSNGLFARLGFQLCAHLPGVVLFPGPDSSPRDVGIWTLTL